MTTRILLADDDAVFRRSMRRSLRHAGFEVHVAVDGPETVKTFDALRAGDALSPELVILDRRMPGLDGDAVLGALRQRDPALPAVFVTGDPSGLALEADVPVLTKPIGGEVLLDAVRTALRRESTGPTTDRRLDTARSLGRPSGSARLVVTEGLGLGTRHDLIDHAVIGRGTDVDLVLDDSKVSRRHAKVTHDPADGFVIYDLGSRNGTFVNGQRVDRAVLDFGDRIEIGGHMLTMARFSPLQEQIIERQRYEALGRLATGVAHDFRNMLAVVLANRDYLMSATPQHQRTHDTQECLDDIGLAVARATELASRMLEFARCGEGGFGVINVSELCTELTALLRGGFPRSIEIRCETEPGLYVMGDRAELQQVFTNLMVNARDAMPDGGVLTVAAHGEMRSGKPWVLVRVQDDGEGMNAATRARIFEPFFSTKGERGFGLGLATVYNIVKAHSGEIDVRSKARRGTTFSVRLRQLDRKSTPPRRRRTISLSESATLAPLRVLVVDDDAMACRSAARLLEQRNHEVSVARDGRQAIKAFVNADPKPDLVLLDLDMPNLDGRRTYALLRGLSDDVSVVICSGKLEPDEEEGLLERGVAAVLRKPYTAKEMERALGLAIPAPTSSDDHDTGVHPAATWPIPSGDDDGGRD